MVLSWQKQILEFIFRPIAGIWIFVSIFGSLTRFRLSEVEQDNAALTDKGRKDAVRIDQLENERDKLQDR